MPLDAIAEEDGFDIAGGASCVGKGLRRSFGAEHFQALVELFSERGHPNPHDEYVGHSLIHSSNVFRIRSGLTGRKNRASASPGMPPVLRQCRWTRRKQPWLRVPDAARLRARSEERRVGKECR